MADTTAHSLALKTYRARALQFLAGVRFPASREEILACYTRKNTPMELLEDTQALTDATFATASEFAEAVTAIHAHRQPHRWTSREWTD